MSKRINKQIDKLTEDFNNLSREIMEVSVYSLYYASKGQMDLPTDLIYAIDGFDIEKVILWFERYGKLKWSNKKGKFVESKSGKWNLKVANRTDIFSHKPLEFPILREFVNGNPEASFGIDSSYTEISAINIKEQISEYLKNNPIDENTMGKFGLPADKNRWGRYKLKIKHK